MNIENIENIVQESAEKYVLVFSDCVPVSGHTVSAIYDLTRGSISTFPSEYFPLFEQLATHRLGQLVDAFPPDDRANLLEFLEFLLGHEYAALVDDPGSFPAIPSTWDAPCSIQDAIIDVDARPHDYPKIIAELDALGCLHLQVRSYATAFGLAELAELARLCRGTSIQTLQAVLRHDPALRDDDYVAAVTSARIVVGLLVHSAPEDRRLRVDYGARGASAALASVEIELTTTPLESHLDCGTITRKQLLPPSTPTFNELRHFNGCLNRKISIDGRGHVRNCPAMKDSYGHHETTALTDVVAQASFRRAWSAKKDEIEVCRDCQYRYACTDCRAFLEDPDAEDSKPLKCGYDPYTDTWEDWRTRPSASATLAGYRRRLHLPILESRG